MRDRPAAGYLWDAPSQQQGHRAEAYDARDHKSLSYAGCGSMNAVYGPESGLRLLLLRLLPCRSACFATDSLD